MKSHVVRIGLLSIALLAANSSASSAAKPVEAPRPNPDARKTRQAVVEICRTMITLYHGQKSGMLKSDVVLELIIGKIEKLNKNEAYKRFLRDKSLTDMDRAKRMIHWMLGRPLNKKERELVLQVLARRLGRSKRHEAIILIIVYTRVELLEKNLRKSDD